MDKPGINCTSFKVSVQVNEMNKQHNDILKDYKIPRTHTVIYQILDFFGCTPTFQTRVVSQPIQLGEDWSYKIEFVSKTIRVFGINIKIIKYK